MLAIKVVLVQLLKNFKLEKIPRTPESIEFSVKSVFLTSNVGLPMKFVPLIPETPNT